jgi:hypothetical protein
MYFARRLGARFTQLSNFISDLETVVPEFYQEVGQSLSAWRKPAAKIRSQEENTEADEPALGQGDNS